MINDEAHHAWRVNPESKKAKIDRQLVEEATKWVGGLDRIHKARRILRCFDFSATPFSPSGKQSSEESLFGWIVSDFGRNDAIEAGLVKTPRVVVRDDGMPDVKTYKSKLYHVDEHVRDDLNRSAGEVEPLPDLVMNAYLLLGKDWLATHQAWRRLRYPTPPVMISVANRTETAARVKNAFDKGKILIDELCNPERTLHVDSKVLEMAEAKAEESESLPVSGTDDGDDEPKQRKLTKVEQAELLRRTVDTVGKLGEPGEGIQKVISVGMLSEGWDAKTVTHIMGLRAFSSQLLCEQVVGRGLRRTSYETKRGPHPVTGEEVELFEAEYVNIFGVPFTFLPHEGENGPLPPPPPKIRIEAVRDKIGFLINWPNIIRIDHVYRPKLELNGARPLVLNATERIVQHVFGEIRQANTETLEPVFDSNRPIRSTADLLPWFTGRPVVAAIRSHINLCVADSTWEAQAAHELDQNEHVAAWAKNDHLGFEIAYVFAGIFHKFRPDLLIRLTTGTHLIVEMKGENTSRDVTKRRYLEEWVRSVNGHGGFGEWQAHVCLHPSELPTKIRLGAMASTRTKD